MAAKKPCKEPGCERPKFQGFHRCYWHNLLTEPPDRQAESSAARLRGQEAKEGYVYRARVPALEWPAGERWCAGCQTFVPTFYVRGSRCIGCDGKAAHGGHVKRTYGITGDEYEAMLVAQGGVCYICHRRSHKRRLAVDHDHRCQRCGGEGCRACVRGLLCADNERGCNHAILGNIKDIDMARRIVEYLEDPPFRRLQHEAPPPARGGGASDVFAELFG